MIFLIKKNEWVYFARSNKTCLNQALDLNANPSHLRQLLHIPLQITHVDCLHVCTYEVVVLADVHNFKRYHPDSCLKPFYFFLPIRRSYCKKGSDYQISYHVLQYFSYMANIYCRIRLCAIVLYLYSII